MKRRNRLGHHHSASRGRKALRPFAKRVERKRKSWTFERLEDRMVFSVSPTVQAVSFSSDTPEGAALTLLDEMRWAQMAAASAQTLDASAPNYTTMSLPNDPYFPNPNDPNQLYSQWYLLNLGQNVAQVDLQHLFGVAGEDLHVVDAWNMVDDQGRPIDGTGVTVAVIDTGVQLFHPDLAGNISPTLRFNSQNGTNIVSPDLLSQDGFHGTAVAGIIGAVANNGEGGSGVAPGVTIVPIRADVVFGFGQNGFTDQSLERALLYALEHDIDITNNSLGPGGRVANLSDPTLLQILRGSVINGRGGLGMINVYSAGNDGGAGGTVGFPSLGEYASASYNPLVNSRFTIGVGGVDHDGLYANADGTFTSYPESGPSVLVAAPTGNSVLGATNIADDDGFGSGIVTTDLFGDFGLNAEPLPNGFDRDRDFLADPNYTSRMNGTSASAPMVSGVIALMLQANPNLTYRDVQEILVRSSRQNAEFEFPTSGGIGGSFRTKNTWQTNQTGPFRNPDVHPNFGLNPFYDGITNAFYFPIADPNFESFFNFGGFGFQNFAPNTNDGSRQEASTYEPMPALFTNGAGYTVSQGYGIYGEQLGYAHGVVDAAAAVTMAKQWHTLGQNMDPNTELTYTTALVSPIGNIPAAERLSLEHGATLIPGGIAGVSGFSAYWDQYWADTPFDNYTGKLDIDRGSSYIDFAVPPSQEMDVEWVEVKLDLAGAGATSVDGLNGLRIMLTSPNGTQSELNNYYPNASWAPYSTQPSSTPANGWGIDFGQGLNGTPVQDHFVWTFSTNRSFGESSNSEVIIHPVTGEPVMQTVDFFDPITQTFTISDQPIFRNWELHIENWSHSAFNLDGVEIVWHGKPIGGGKFDPNYDDNGIISAQRVQGVVGIDQNGDNQFNFNRYVQTVANAFTGPHTDVSDIRDGDVVRQLDFNDNNHNDIYDEGDTINQEQFAANVIVDAYKVWDGVAEATPTARFLTGADGNYYFDLDVQGDLAQTKQLGGAHFGQTIEYQIRATDQNAEPRLFLDDLTTPSMTSTNPAFTYLPHYKSSWTINPNWFFAADHDNPNPLGDNPGEVFFDPTGNAIASFLLNPSDLPEPGLPAPLPFTNNAQLEHIVPAAVKNLNFLLKDDAPASSFDVIGTVYSDVNGDGQFNGTDAGAANVSVYWDQNRNGVHDSGELTVTTDATGQYSLPIDLTTLSPVPTQKSTYQIGVIKPASDWEFTDPGLDGVEAIFAGPGSPDQNVNFFLRPPSSQNNNGNGPGTIQGAIYSDLNNNHVQDLGEPGVPNFRVFIDADLNGVWDSATETSVLTGVNGSFFFSNVQPGLYRIDIVIPNEGTPNAAWVITTPAVGYRDVQLLPGATITGVKFGLDNRAGNDWGDLPNSFLTTSAVNGPRHKVQLGFQLGATIDGEVNGQPGPGATNDTSDDGVVVLSNGGVLQKGVNTLEVTVTGVGGLLTGWMDFNNDGHFDESERLTWTLGGSSLGGEADLNPGTYDLQITIPAGAVDHRPIAARFRWGEQGLSFTGPAQIGEVEDYYFGLNFLAGDYNRDGFVNQADYLVWRKQNGQNVTPYNGADGNGDGVVNQADFDIWRANFGNTLPGAGAGAAASALTAGELNNQASTSSTAASGSEYLAVVDRTSSSSSSPSYYVLSSPPSFGTTSDEVTTSEPAGAPSDGDTSNTTVAASDSSLSGSATFASFVADTSSSNVDSKSTSLVGSSTAGSDSSNSDLLLLDQAWADVDRISFEDEDSLYHDESHELMSTNDLALAAVLKEDDDWWSEI